MTTLAYQGDERICSEYLAVGAQTNAGLIRRILSKLSQANLVNCQKGKNGGSTLAQASNKISVGQIYAAINDEPVFASFEKEPFKECPVSCQIGNVLSDIFEEVEKPMLDKMNEIKLSTLVSRIE
jgi:DNA-binding IscR family transcriptional regulator